MSDDVRCDPVAQAIDRGYEERPRSDKPRQYIGASNVGNDCEAALAFSLRGYPDTPPSPKLQRVFNLGHLIEDIVVADLKKRADIRVWEKDGLTGRQHAYDLFGGHVSCHMDGHVEIGDCGEVGVLEVKSMAQTYFNKCMKHGVQKSHPKYFSQLQLMMGMSGMRKSLLVAYCKNTSRYLSEIVEFDEFEYEALLAKIDIVMMNDATKVSTKPDDWRCKGCFKRGVCWENLDVPRECNTCSYAIADERGIWFCLKYEKEAINPCDEYKKYMPKER